MFSAEGDTQPIPASGIRTARFVLGVVAPGQTLIIAIDGLCCRDK